MSLTCNFHIHSLGGKKREEIRWNLNIEYLDVKQTYSSHTSLYDDDVNIANS